MFFMAEITMEQIKQLRALTGAGIMDAKKALTEVGGNIEKAVDLLRKAGQLKALKKQTREATQGIVTSYIHGNGTIGALVKLNCETDFVARNDAFKKLAHNIAMQVAAMKPDYIRPEDVPNDILEKEKEIYRAQLKKEKKPENIIEKIIDGKIEKFFSEVCLVKQTFFKDEDKTIEDLITEKIATLGEKIEVGEMKRIQL